MFIFQGIQSPKHPCQNPDGAFGFPSVCHRRQEAFPKTGSQMKETLTDVAHTRIEVLLLP